MILLTSAVLYLNKNTHEESETCNPGEIGSFLNMWCFVIAPILESMGRKFDFLGTHADR